MQFNRAYRVFARSLHGAPGLEWLDADLGPLLHEEKAGVTLEDYRHSVDATSSFSVDLRVEADSEQEARELTYAWLEVTLKDAAQWRRETDVVFDDEGRR